MKPPAGEFCGCGKPTALVLFVRYRYPRTEPLPEAMDPCHVQGGGCRITTCGDPACEPDAFLACRQRIIDGHAGDPAGLSATQMAGLELVVSA